MKTRFPKVWCEACKSMQFLGECGHARPARAEPAGCSTGLAIRLNRADCKQLEANATAIAIAEAEAAVKAAAAERRRAEAEGLLPR